MFLFVHFHSILFINVYVIFSPRFIYELSGRSGSSFNHFNSSSLSSSFFFPLFALKSNRTQYLLVISCSTSLCFPGLFGRSYFSTFFTYTVFFFYKNSFYKNHQAQNYQKIKNILRIMSRLKYMINNLESSILILHQESALFTMECLLFTMAGLQFRKTCIRNQHTNQSKHS